MFERFSQGARRVVVDAQRLARSEQAAEVTATHLLRAVVAGDDAAADVFVQRGLDAGALAGERPLGPRDAEALQSIGVDLGSIREAVESTFGSGSLESGAARTRGLFRRRNAGHVGFSRGARTTLELSLRECLRLQDSGIETTHVALGLLRVADRDLTATLTRHRVDVAELRSALERSRRRTA